VLLQVGKAPERARHRCPGLRPGECSRHDPSRRSAACVVLGVVLDRLILPSLPTLQGDHVVLRGHLESDVDDRLRHPIDPEEEDGYGSSWRREWDARRYHTRLIRASTRGRSSTTATASAAPGSASIPTSTARPIRWACLSSNHLGTRSDVCHSTSPAAAISASTRAPDLRGRSGSTVTPSMPRRKRDLSGILASRASLLAGKESQLDAWTGCGIVSVTADRRPPARTASSASPLRDWQLVTTGWGCPVVVAWC